MRPDVLDQMLALALEQVTVGDESAIKSLVRDMARRWPEEKALAVSFALSSAAAEVDEILSLSNPAIGPGVAYRVAALVAADVLAIEALGRQPALCRDLLQFWRRVDPWFLQG